MTAGELIAELHLYPEKAVVMISHYEIKKDIGRYSLPTFLTEVGYFPSRNIMTLQDDYLDKDRWLRKGEDFSRGR